MTYFYRIPLPLAPLVWLLVVALLVVATGSNSAAAAGEDDIKPLKSGVSISGVIEDDYSDGLLLTTDQGVSYMVLTPEEVTLEQEEAFHKKFKGQTVTLTGNVFRDEDGSLSLFVMKLPMQ
ncbi:hypothetical protein [Desulfovibrio sp. TomC]|uniref:hypothetical protein n=1 Tax=Desulfovibrio sp. TomC TaxID=1562888 RepID=UPI00057578BE|nr:hypothetical protein [Desulfovibrio sp. TomC]KHK00679.1 hypothetical protein NY78_3942 [Desulfovibrio sp. TomC]